MNSSRPFALYVLIDPDGAKKIRYFGKTSIAIKTRLTQHIHAARKQNSDGSFFDKSYRAKWIRSVLNQNRLPEIREIARYETLEEVNKSEQFFIYHARQAGDFLTNMTDGGDGGIKTRKPACSDQEVIDAYKTGLSYKAVARLLKTCGKRVLRVLMANNIPIRNSMKPISDEYGRKFNSLSEAAEYHGSSVGSISNQLKGKAKTGGGHVFSYLNHGQ